MESKSFNKEAYARELLKKYHIKDFFGECNQAGLPFLFALAFANDEVDTKYYIDTLSADSMGIELTNDKFVDLLNVINGFTTVLNPNINRATIEGLQSIKIAPEGSSYYDDDSLKKFYEDQGITIVKGKEGIPDEDFDAELFPEKEHTPEKEANCETDDIYKEIAQSITDGDMFAGHPGESDQCADILRKRKPMVLKSSQISLALSSEPEEKKSYVEEFKEIDERHKNILKGNGSFIKKKEEELRSFGKQ